MNPNDVTTLRQTVAAGGITTVLRDRFWTAAVPTTFTPQIIETIDPTRGGIVLTGAGALAAARDVRAAHPGVPLLVAPASGSTHEATPDRPFLLDDGRSKTDLQGVLFEQTVEEVLDHQRDAGADMVITPSGQVGAQDTAALKAIVRRSNAIKGNDVLTQIVVLDDWMTGTWVKTLCAVLRDSEHPVLLGLANSFTNPLNRKQAVAGYQQVAQEVGQVVAWHADVSGLGFAAHGGLGAMVGLRASGRRYARVGVGPRSSKPKDPNPYVLLPDMLRYSRTSTMREEWFASAAPPRCTSPCCRGRAVDRFEGTEESVAAAHLHNTTRLSEMVHALTEVEAAARPAWWRSRVNDAVAAHAEVGARIGRKLEVPADIQQWADLSD